MMLITVRPGPVLHVWRGGQEVAAIPLTLSAALQLCRDVLFHLGSNDPQSEAK